MLVRSLKDITWSIRQNMTFETKDENDDMYLIQYIAKGNTEVKFDWFKKEYFEPVNDVCGVTGQPGIERVNHPKHYNKGIEVWDYTDSWKMDFLEGNIIKYVTRYKHKNGIEDLKKAKQYIERLIEREVNKNGEIEK